VRAVDSTPGARLDRPLPAINPVQLLDQDRRRPAIFRIPSRENFPTDTISFRQTVFPAINLADALVESALA